MNVLLSSVGRRNYLVDYFREALAGSGLVIATNCNPNATAMRLAEKSFIVPQASDVHYIETMLQICKENNVRLLLSLHDWENPFLAENIELFKDIGTTAVVSSPDVIHTCLDKYATFLFLKEKGIIPCQTYVKIEDTQKALTENIISYPLILKPRCGQGSLGIEIVKTDTELMCAFQLLKNRLLEINGNGLLHDNTGQDIVIQKFINGIEYGLDVVNDLKGNYVTCFVKRKLGMRAGETDAAETVINKNLEAVGRKIGTAIGHIGLMDVDVIICNNIPYVIDMNPRFGGHYPFSHMAGANIPAAMIAWARGQKADPNWLKIKPGVRCIKELKIAVIRECEKTQTKLASKIRQADKT